MKFDVMRDWRHDSLRDCQHMRLAQKEGTSEKPCCRIVTVGIPLVLFTQKEIEPRNASLKTLADDGSMVQDPRDWPIKLSKKILRHDDIAPTRGVP